MVTKIVCNSCDEIIGHTKVKSCIPGKLIYFAKGETLVASTKHFNEPSGRCHDCNIVHGKYHHTGCDVERCPKCNDQLISCNCF